jgi:hypothetical protein
MSNTADLHTRTGTHVIREITDTNIDVHRQTIAEFRKEGWVIFKDTQYSSTHVVTQMIRRTDYSQPRLSPGSN